MPLSINRLKFLQSLQNKKYRHKYGYFLAEGEKAVSEFAEGNVFRPECIISAHPDMLMPYSGKFETELADVRQMEKISSMSTAPLIAALIPFSVSEVPDPQTIAGWAIGLDRINDPGNLGSIIRIADWYGLDSIYLSESCADVFNPKTVSASMGSLARVRPFTIDFQKWIPLLKVPSYAAVLDGEDLRMVQKIPGLIIIGSESHGLHPDLIQCCTKKITIVRPGAAESLNAAVAAGIICDRMILG